MNSEPKRFRHKYLAIAAIISSSSGFFITLLVCNDVYYGCMGGWDWISGVFLVAFASLLLFVAGLCLLIFKKELAAAFVLSSVLLTGSYLIGLYVMEKATLIFYGERQYEKLAPESNEHSDKPSQ